MSVAGIALLGGLLAAIAVLLASVLYTIFGTTLVIALLVGVFVAGLVYLIDLLTTPSGHPPA